MKKGFLFLVFLLACASLFAQESITVIFPKHP